MSEDSLIFLPENKTVALKGETSVLELALRNGVELGHSCGGMGTCTTCRIFVENSVDNLPPRNELEAEMAADRNFKPNERLGCQITPQPGWRVRIPGGKT